MTCAQQILSPETTLLPATQEQVMVDRTTATERQAIAFGQVWTISHNLLSRISYVRASPLRILRHALRMHGLRGAKGLNVLEYGFGHGYGLFSFDRSTRLHGVELSDAAIQAVEKRAKAYGYERFEFRKTPSSDPVRIEFPSDYFDVVICSHTIEHVYNDGKLVAELHRVLKPGGKCFFLVPLDLDHTRVLKQEEERQNPDFPQATYHVWQYNAETFSWLCEQAGLHVLQSERIDAILAQRLQWNRALQLGASLFFAVAPFRWWQLADAQSQRRGYHGKQCLLVGTKLQALNRKGRRDSPAEIKNVIGNMRVELAAGQD